MPRLARSGKGLREVEAAIYRLINRHGRSDGDKFGDGYWADNVIKLVIHHNPDGKYLIKGGGHEVWRRFGVRKEDRRSQGLIFGKRCGTTENIGSAARSRLRRPTRVFSVRFGGEPDIESEAANVA